VRSGKITVAVLATVVLLSCGALVLPWFGDLLTLTKRCEAFSSRAACARVYAGVSRWGCRLPYSASQPWAVVTACLVEMNIIKVRRKQLDGRRWLCWATLV